MANNELNSLALGYAGATLSAVCMLLVGIGWNLGIYVGAAEAMAKWHMFFNASVTGVLAGMAEATVWGFVSAYVFGWLYNRFV
ncbi:hypothetical protein J4418_04880 [Candidatus Woesearchaeota archaeon]|nr:hypothetical protein [Candidatus Woesearchaeota archaeon]